MTDKHKPPILQVKANLSQLGIAGRLTLLALIAKFAPTSSQYAGDPAFKAAVDAVTAHGPTLTQADDASEAARKAALVALVARDTETAATDTDFGVLRAQAERLFKTEADFHNNGLNMRTKSLPVPLTAPITVTAIAGRKVKGTINAHALRIAGLTKYICAISVDPVTPTSYSVLNGTAAKRTISGLDSGKGYWIKFCTERGDARSDWSAPVYCVAS